MYYKAIQYLASEECVVSHKPIHSGRSFSAIPPPTKS